MGSSRTPFSLSPMSGGMSSMSGGMGQGLGNGSRARWARDGDGVWERHATDVRARGAWG